MNNLEKENPKSKFQNPNNKEENPKSKFQNQRADQPKREGEPKIENEETREIQNQSL